MDWKSLIKGVAPVVGTALGGPLGAAAVSVIADALGLSDKTEEAIKKVIGQGLTPEQEVALQLAEKNFALEQLKINAALTTKLAELEVQYREADSSDLAQVNATMREEAKSEHWMQWSWRPFNGFMFGVTMFGCYFVLPVSKISPPSIPFEAWTAWGAIVGVTAWFRGRGQVVQQEKK